MLPNPTTTTFVMLFLGVFIFILLLLLPALIELKRPRDAGPRTIMDNMSEIRPHLAKAALMMNVEEEQGFDQTLVKKIADIIAVLPSLEA